MAEVTRVEAVRQVRRTIGAYRDRVHETRNDTRFLPPEGARIVNEYCSFENDWQELVQDAIRETSFLDGMDDRLLLEYCAVCMELDEVFGLGSWRIGRVDRIVKDMDDRHRLSYFVNNSLKPKMEGFFDAQTTKTICSALETPMAEDKRLDILKKAIASSSTELDMADIPDFFLNGKRINTEIKPEKEPWWAKMFQGTDIHKKIAKKYEEMHPNTQTIRSNYYPVKSLLSALGFSSTEINMLSEKERNMKPDITNLTLMHLYEIKPEGREMQAKKEVEKYKEAMNKALAPEAYIILGPTTDEGVKGQIVTKKGKLVNYASPMDGVIIYQVQSNKEKQPLHIAIPEVKMENIDFFSMEYWARVTGLCGAALLMFVAFMVALPPFGIPG